jgi:hypothetical protein
MSSSFKDSARPEAQKLASHAIKSYATKLQEMSPGDARDAAVRTVVAMSRDQPRVDRQPTRSGVDVKGYAAAVIESASQTSHKERVVYSHAAALANEGQVGLSSAARIAQQAVRQYDHLRQQGPAIAVPAI